MALSRLAKKFRELEKHKEQTTTTTAAVSKKPVKVAPQVKAVAPPPTPPSVVEEPPAPCVPEAPPKPGKRSREVPKRPRFVYVPTKTEQKTPPTTSAPVAPRSNKLAAKLMTKNLALPPEDETPGGLPGLVGRGRV